MTSRRRFSDSTVTANPNVVNLVDEEGDGAHALPITTNEPEASESSGASSALPDFSWQGMSASDVDGESPPVLDAAADHTNELGVVAMKRPRSEPHEADEVYSTSFDNTTSDLFLFDESFLFSDGDQFGYFNDGGAFASLLDVAFGGDAAGVSTGLWSFGDDSVVDSACY